MSGTWDVVEELIAGAEAGGATIGVAIAGSHGETFSHNADRRFRAASTVKIPVMTRIFRRIDAGDISLTDEVTLTADIKCAGSGVLQDMHDGLVVTIADLVYLMMSISDNTATNLLIDIAGMDDVNALMRELGMSESVLGRKMQGFAASGAQAENWAIPAEYTRLVQGILDDKVASKESCKEMTRILEQQQNSRRIGRHIPEDVKWGSKTGSIEGVENDVGFVMSDAGTVCISVYCEGLPDMHVGEKLIGDIAREAVAITGVATPLRLS